MSHIANEDVILEKALLEIGHIMYKHDTIDSTTGRNFNFFSVLGIGEREVYICRCISELLSPNGSHGQKSLYLEIFNEFVLKEIGCYIVPKELSEGTVVDVERSTETGRRIDIVIVTKSNIIGIEAKINAQDLKGQLADYMKGLKWYDKKKSYLIYLTKYGNPPSSESLNGDETKIGKEDIKRISFKNHIVSWLTECLKHPNTQRAIPVREFILQLLSNIKKFTNQLDDEREMEIENLLNKHPEYIRAFFYGRDAIDKLIKKKVNEIFDKVKENVKKKVGSEEWLSGTEDGNSRGKYNQYRYLPSYDNPDRNIFDNNQILSYVYRINRINKAGKCYYIVVALQMDKIVFDTKDDTVEYHVGYGIVGINKDGCLDGTTVEIENDQVKITPWQKGNASINDNNGESLMLIKKMCGENKSKMEFWVSVKYQGKFNIFTGDENEFIDGRVNDIKKLLGKKY